MPVEASAACRPAAGRRRACTATRSPERHRLHLVVGHVDRRRAEPLVQALELGAHLHAELRVEVRQRLVHQERLRLAHHRAADRDPLALAAGQLGGLAIQQPFEPEDRGDVDAPGAVARPSASCRSLSPNPRFCLDRHVRVQGVVLEHHRDVAELRLEVGDLLAADRDLAGGDLLQTRRSSAGSWTCRTRTGPTSTMNSPSPTSSDTSFDGDHSSPKTFVTPSRTISAISALLPAASVRVQPLDGSSSHVSGRAPRRRRARAGRGRAWPRRPRAARSTGRFGRAGATAWTPA